VIETNSIFIDRVLSQSGRFYFSNFAKFLVEESGILWYHCM